MAPSRNRRPGFSRRAQYGLFLSYVLAIAGAVVGVVLLVLSTFNPPAFAALRSGVAEITTPISSVLAGTVRGIVAIPETIATYFRVHNENEALRRETVANRALLIRARSIAYDNIRLRRLLKMRDADPAVVATARVVSSTASSTRRFGLLNAGIWQGVREGQPVRGPVGLIGRVIEAGPNTARVLLITDPTSVVPVRRARDGRPGFASGRGDGMLDIRLVESIAVNFRSGDLFVTSGTGGLYAPGTPVAQIFARSGDTAIARPFASPDALDFAIVSRAFLPPPPPPRPVVP